MYKKCFKLSSSKSNKYFMQAYGEVDHMNKFDLFSKRQFGLMGGRSTSLQLLKVLDKSMD